MSSLLSEHFAIRVKIFKASDLPHPNISSLVCVQVGSNKKYSSTVRNTDKPVYNDYFVFDLSMEFSTLMSIIITVAMYQPRKAYKYKRLIGCISLDTATVWAHRDHRLKKWLSLFLPSDPTGKLMALVQCEIIVEAPDRYKNLYQLSPVESPDVIGGMRARYKVQLYRCIGLEIGDSKKNVSRVSIRVSFAGNSKSTTKRPLQQWPEWNEQITFIEFFPPLFQKITVDIIVGKKFLASKQFYLPQFSNVSTDGYLPTLGPTYIHFYTNGYVYQASLSISIQTELISLFRFDERFHGVTVESVRPLPKESYGSMGSFLCYGVLFDVALINIDYSYKDFSVCISFGGTGRKILKNDLNNTSTLTYNSVKRNKHFAYLPLEENKPCVFIRSDEPNSLHRLFNMNLLSKTADNLRGRIDYANELSVKGNEGEAKGLLKESLQKLKSDCAIVSKQFSMGITQLDKDRMRFILKQLTSIKSTVIGGMNFRALLEKSKEFLSILDTVCEDVQNSLPNLIVVLKSAKKVIGYSVVLPNKIIFSHSELKKGCGSGKINYLVLNDESNNCVGRLDIWLWLGFWNQVGQCLRALPPGHEDISKVVTLPLNLTFTASKFSVICRIYGGRIADGLDHEGLCDSFLSVVLSTQSQRTSTKKRSLVPLWKETLVLEELNLYHSPVYIQQNPPPISLYLWDENPNNTRLLGTASVIPVVRLQPFSSFIDYNLQWTKLGNLNEILAAFEIIQISDESESSDKLKMSTVIPQFIDPPTVSFKLELVFWGIRPSYFGCLTIVNRPQAIIQFGSTELKSNIITDLKFFPNFGHNLLVARVEMPETKLYSPPLVIRVTASVKFIGSGVENNAHLYTIQLPTKYQWDDLIAHRKSLVDRAEARRSLSRDSMPDLIPLMEIDAYSRTSSSTSQQQRFIKSPVAFCRSLKSWFIYLKSFLYTVEKKVEKILDDNDENDEDHDWWHKYFSGILSKYTNKLEDQKEYGGFNDVLRTFIITRQTAGFEKDVAKLKVLISLYQWPVQENVVTPRGEDPEMGVLKQNELSERVKLLVRVYCVKAFDLHPADPNGKADPYIEVATPSNVVSDKLNYVPNQLNPVFGRCLEITATFPVDTMLAVRVMDWDRLTKHDLIGETIIDLENRFYSKHRGTCGLASAYSISGFNSWRDVEKPTEILERLCNTYNLPLPQYYSRSILVACKEFVLIDVSRDEEEMRERLALEALHHWHELPVIGRHLVTEHVETRSLFKKEKPGLEQGKLELWVDLFDLSMGQIPLPINITPRKPQSYELRVVIWNTSKVPMVDDSYFVGKKSTDIFVKGWLWDSNDAQMTDVHYNSINGEGNFNWRFIFQFQYFRSEKVMVFYKKCVWDLATTEVKVPPLLHLQVWDRDRLSADDFIGDMVIELNKMPRGARSVKMCKLRPPLTPSQGVDLFKVKQMRGWWPFIREKKDEIPTSGGFLEAEFQLLTDEEAIAKPAGMGRSEPMALPPPMRPEFRTKFWLAPFRILMHLICKVHKTKFIFGLLICASGLFVLIGVYSLPMFLTKKLLDA